jgi:antitoxin (DNA-binding transcriptional repressor) of toxin-antitoxin stability system
MRTITIDELEGQLNGYLQSVKNGEEIIVRDHDVPVARILPFHPKNPREHEAFLVASGALKMPEEVMDWDAFFALPAGNVPHDVAVQAAIDGRGDR